MEIAACRAGDIEVLDRFMPSHGVDGSHAARFARQAAGHSTYLIQTKRPLISAQPGCAARTSGAADACVFLLKTL
ncbi:hypothetical protein ABZ078_38660 [Streptomyces sp. NPDC006385]|uniref:hypothetical protein n=1 Tax=Streptomyces sp. NPDC006385 TaxID=3156761 RepID=UPI0033BD8D2B